LDEILTKSQHPTLPYLGNNFFFAVLQIHQDCFSSSGYPDVYRDFPSVQERMERMLQEAGVQSLLHLLIPLHPAKSYVLR
jgi:hypothetical protein